jgi:hypothetical protein
MSILQKIAWLNLAILGLVAAAFAVVLFVRDTETAVHYLVVSSVVYTGAWVVVVVFFWLGRLVNRLRGKQNKVYWDERDELIQYKAFAWAGPSAYIFMVFGTGYYVKTVMEKWPKLVQPIVMADVTGLSFLLGVTVYSVVILLCSRNYEREQNVAQ